MKKFLAVLLAVALLGVAGAAFAGDDAGHGGHYDKDVVTLTLDGSTLAKLGSDVKSLDVSNLSGDYDGGTNTKVKLLQLTGLTKGTKYAFGVTLDSVKSNVVPGSTKLYDEKRDTAVTKLAAAEAGWFYGSDGADLTGTTTIEEKAAYAVFVADGGDATLYAEGTEIPGGPTSNKGSGGCNAGFASIAVLALGLAALRRKAR